MNSQHLDELTKSLATTTSRPQTVKAIFAGVVGGAFGLSAVNVASAQSSRRNNMPASPVQDCADFNQPCNSNSDCCSNFCYLNYCF